MATRTDTATTSRQNKNPAQKAGDPSRRNATPGNGGEAVADELYGVVSVLYHALQGAENNAKYCDDARSAGDEELVEFFETCRDEETARARMAKSLLAERLEDGELEGDDEGDENASSEEDDEET
jgi:hypothetical protein